jgi:hypothetical protein
MNYGQALEAMKRGGAARRAVGSVVRLVERGTPLAYIEIVEAGVGRKPFAPSVADQLAEDWQIAMAPVKEAA